MRELTLDECEQVAGGVNWGQIAAGAALVGIGIAAVGTAGLAGIPLAVFGAATFGELAIAGFGIGSAAGGGWFIGSSLNRY